MHADNQKCIQSFSGKRPLGRPRRRWEDDIQVDLREVGCVPGDYIALAEDSDQWRAYVINL